MTNKKEYQAPSIDLLKIDEKDIIVTSVAVGEWDDTKGANDGFTFDF